MAGLKMVWGGRTAARHNLGARLLWEASRLHKRLGWGLPGGALALGLAAALAWQGHRLAAERRDLVAQIAAARSMKSAPVATAPDAGRRIEAFHNYLPAHEAIPELLKQLVAVAARNRITLAKADYKPQGEDGFLRYRITLPIKADYADVQAFIVGALAALPTLTLDSVTFSRDRIGSAGVEARIHLTLLVRQPATRGGSR